MPGVCWDNGLDGSPFRSLRQVFGLGMDTCEILDGFHGRQPNFHKWARPAYEQGALPTLSLLPGEVMIKVLPGDKFTRPWKLKEAL